MKGQEKFSHTQFAKKRIVAKVFPTNVFAETLVSPVTWILWEENILNRRAGKSKAEQEQFKCKS